MEDPHRTKFERGDLVGYVREQHPKLLTSALSVLRGFVAADQPGHSRRPLGKFEAWDKLIRGGVIWATTLAGETVDPLDTAARLQEEAPDRDGLSELLEAWDVAVPGWVPVTAPEVTALPTALIGSLSQAQRAPRSRARDRISRTAGDFRRLIEAGL